MAEVLRLFDSILVDDSGIRYRARTCGSEMPDGRWQGWIEFVPLDGGEVLRSPRETTQPNHADLVYWSTGLTAVYLEGALERALNPLTVEPAEVEEPAYDGPAPAITTTAGAATTEIPEAVLDPFEVYESGETHLRRQLAALSVKHLVNIIVAYELSDEPVSSLRARSEDELIGMIVGAVVALRPQS